MENTLELISIPDVQKRLRIGRTKLWELTKQPDFPKLVRLTERRKVFVKSEIDAWIAAKIAERDEVTA